MPFPAMTALPPEPSRTGDPSNFVSEAGLILSALPDWRTDANAAGTYLNALQADIWNWGLISYTPPTREQITAMPDLPSGTPEERAYESDAFLAAMVDLTTEANDVGTYLDTLSAYSEPYELAADGDRPTIGTVSTAPARGNTATAFNTNADGFFSSAKSWATAVGGVADNFYNRLIAPEDFGAIADAVTSSDDFGTLT